jgi:hypothetical protein
MGRWIIAGTTLFAILACGGGADVSLGVPDVSTTCTSMFEAGEGGWSAFDGKQVQVTGEFRGSNSNFEMVASDKALNRCKLTMATGEAKTGFEGKQGTVQCTADSFTASMGPDLTGCRHVGEAVDAPDDDGGKEGKSPGGKDGKTKEGKNPGGSKDGKSGKSKGGKNK